MGIELGLMLGDVLCDEDGVARVGVVELGEMHRRSRPFLDWDWEKHLVSEELREDLGDIYSEKNGRRARKTAWS